MTVYFFSSFQSNQAVSQQTACGGSQGASPSRFRRILLLLLFFSLAARDNLATAGDPPTKSIQFSDTTMGSIVYKVLLNDLPATLTDKAQIKTGIDRRLETINDQMSTYRPDSELSRFNRYQ